MCGSINHLAVLKHHATAAYTHAYSYYYSSLAKRAEPDDDVGRSLLERKREAYVN